MIPLPHPRIKVRYKGQHYIIEDLDENDFCLLKELKPNESFALYDTKCEVMFVKIGQLKLVYGWNAYKIWKPKTLKRKKKRKKRRKK